MSISIRNHGVSAAIVAALSLSLSACSDSAEDNEAQACDAISEFKASVAKIGSLSTESTVEEIRATRSDVQKSYRALVTTLDDVADDRHLALDEAYDTFNDSVDDLASDASLADAVASLQEEAAAITSAQVAISDELSC